MTPPARLAAAIGLLDRILAGAGAEQVLTDWGRANRYAGSGDRAGIRDLIYDALRCKRSFGALGGAMTGRGLILGGVRAAGLDEAALFSGEGYAPEPPGPQEMARAPAEFEALDCPDWLAGPLQASLGADFAPVMQALRRRAPVFLRVNLCKTNLTDAARALADEGIATRPVNWVKTALEVTENARKIQKSSAFVTGLVELQDAASQAVVAALPLGDGQRVLDYCAGGGGKALAMAALAKVEISAHDADPRRMRDLPARAARAGVQVRIVDSVLASDAYDLVLTDVPCSGSGSWRRDPAGKWALTAGRLGELTEIQAAILRQTARMVARGGHLAYVTCSLLHAENEAQVAGFLAGNPDWAVHLERRFSPLDGGDGFYLALLARLD